MRPILGQASFNRMPLNQKMDLIDSHGNLLSARVKRGFVVMLYRMDNFFVELWRTYDSGVKDVKAILSFNSSIGLHPYKHISKNGDN